MSDILQNIPILDAGAEGMAVGRTGDQVIFLPFVVPGDVVDVRVIRKKKKYLEGRLVRLVTPSPKRIEPHCSHFGLCGGCRWQNMLYEDQLFYKQKQVYESLTRIGRLEDPVILPILPSPATRYYRNKLDFTFSVHRWLTEEDRQSPEGTIDTRALGFHIPQFFDKAVDIRECFHMKDPVNAIRMEARRYAVQNGLAFYDVRKWDGFLRNLIIRNTASGGLMLILVVRYDDDAVRKMCDHLASEFPEITSIYYVVNPKQNDSLYDLEFRLHCGDPWITEIMPPFRPESNPVEFRIGPNSFFQTNSLQAVNLYRIVAEFADFKGDESVYDLYTGTGTIANYIAPYVRKVTGIETVAAAIEDAGNNSELNRITNTEFFAGEAEKILTSGFIERQGIPDIVITDPPRNGMHEKVILAMMAAKPRSIVYVSCNPATQARDIALLAREYRVVKSQPVDMFPHTQHVENVALLHLRD